ncbi:MAG: PadR family transcriptional regulator [Candidatus Bathyarchaeia archaeon]
MLMRFFLGFIRIHILHHASEGAISGVEMMTELERHGYSVSPGLMYPTLRPLERQGYLKSERKTVGGRVRRFYEATEDGHEALEEAKKKIKELIEEVMT